MMLADRRLSMCRLPLTSDTLSKRMVEKFCFSPLLLYAFLLSPHVAQHILKEDINVFACGYCGQSGEYFFEENNPQDFGSVVKLPKDGEVQSRCCTQKF